MNDLEINYNVFESIKHIDEHGYEYWSARELGKVLEYSEYRKFLLAINKAIVACKLSYQNIDDHFVQTGGMINIGKGGKRKVTDYKLSRYACYLIVQNADSKKDKVIGENMANDIHYNVGVKIRKTIKELGGTMPEDLKTPEKSLKELEKEKINSYIK